ncbi:S24 family peptidase [Hahella ganghwensis]|uniref:S24 family peptidase n=1 Tax=Hahella ganghwensis TaxID=286420 RepID=UPI000365BC75|nr:S24 family peptidase [Hahella ganghwensis]
MKDRSTAHLVRRERLKQIVAQMFNGSQKACGDAAGVAPARISNYLSDNPKSQSMGERAARMIEERIGLPEGSLDDANQLPTELQRSIGVLHCSAVRANEAADPEAIAGWMLQQRGYDLSRIIWFTQPDSSMSARIPKGSIAAAHSGGDVVDGDYYLLKFPSGRRAIRRIFVDPAEGNLVIQPENSQYSSHVFASEKVKVIGQIVWYCTFLH